MPGQRPNQPRWFGEHFHTAFRDEEASTELPRVGSSGTLQETSTAGCKSGEAQSATRRWDSTERGAMRPHAGSKPLASSPGKEPLGSPSPQLSTPGGSALPDRRPSERQGQTALPVRPSQPRTAGARLPAGGTAAARDPLPDPSRRSPAAGGGRWRRWPRCAAAPPPAPAAAGSA